MTLKNKIAVRGFLQTIWSRNLWIHEHSAAPKTARQALSIPPACPSPWHLPSPLCTAHVPSSASQKPPPCILSSSGVTDEFLWRAFGSGQAAGLSGDSGWTLCSKEPGVLSHSPPLALGSAMAQPRLCTALTEIHSPVTAYKAGGKKPLLQRVWDELSCSKQGRDALVSLRRRRLDLKQKLFLWLRQGGSRFYLALQPAQEPSVCSVQ